MNFDNFSYSETAKKLEKIISLDRLPHALLIEGAEGSGKSEFAFVLAKAILFGADKKDGDAKEYQNGTYPDLYFFDGRNKGDYSADNLRKIKEEVYISPWVAKKKVFVLANIDACDPRYSNILLKCIEEPPEFVCFILTAHSKHSLLPTIASRVVDYKLLPPPVDYTTNILKMRGVDNERAKTLSSLFGGNIGLAIAAYSDENFARRETIAKEIICKIFKKDKSSIALSLSPLYVDKTESFETLSLLERYFLMLAKENVCQNSSLSVIIGVSTADMSFEKLCNLAKIFRRASDKLSFNGNINISISAMQAELFSAL